MTIPPPNTGRAALDLEQLMQHPRYPAIIERLNALVPADVAEQHRAAHGDALNVLATEAAVLGVPVEDTAVGDLPGWVRLGVLGTFVAWRHGVARTCLHDPRPERPEPVFAAAWKPDLVVCGRCPHLINLRPGSAADRTCDCCGRVVAGPEHDDGIAPCRVSFGALLYAFGTCRSCRADLRGAAA